MPYSIDESYIKMIESASKHAQIYQENMEKINSIQEHLMSNKHVIEASLKTYNSINSYYIKSTSKVLGQIEIVRQIESMAKATPPNVLFDFRVRQILKEEVEQLEQLPEDSQETSFTLVKQMQDLLELKELITPKMINKTIFYLHVALIFITSTTKLKEPIHIISHALIALSSVYLYNSDGKD